MRHREVLGAAALFAVLTVVFFHPVFFQDKTLSAIAGHQSVQFPWTISPTGFPDVAQSDQANNVYPIQADENRLLRKGEFPFWSPYSFGGGPTLGTVYGGGFYPPRFALSFVLAPIQIHDLLLIFHVWLAGFALFLLMRRLQASWLAAVLGGVAWMACPAWFAIALLGGAGALAALMPLALWLMHRAVTGRSTADAVGCGAVLASFVLGASVQPAVFLFPIVCGWGLLLGLNRVPDGTTRGELLRRNLRFVAIAGALGVVLCAFLVLPAASQISASGRAPIPYSQLAADDVGFDDLAHIPDPAVPKPITGSNVWALTFIGIPAAFFALLGLFSRRPGAGVARTLVVLFALLMLGSPLTRVAYSVVPGFAYLSPLGRLLPFLNFGLAMLAALGVDVAGNLIRRFARAPWRPRALTAFAVVAVVAIAIEAYQSMSFSLDVNPPFQPRTAAYLYPRLPLIGTLQADQSKDRRAGDVQRIVAIRRGGPADPFYPPPLVGELPRLFAIENIGGYLNVMPERSRAIAQYLAGASRETALNDLVGAYAAYFFSKDTRYGMLERLGVDEIVTGRLDPPDRALTRGTKEIGADLTYSADDGALLRVPDAQPRAFVVDGVEVASDEADAFARFTAPDFPFRTTVLLDGPGARDTAPAASSKPVEARTRVVPTDPDRRTIEVDSPHAGWLVVLDSYDSGWSAKVNGRDEPIQRADFAYRAVRVPAGHSTVTMDYRTPGLLLGIVVSLLGALAAVALLVRAALRRRAAAVTPGP